MTPNGLVPIVLFGWPVISLILFIFLMPRRAVLVSVFAGWLFLPIAGYTFSGLPDYNHYTATMLGTLLGVLCFDSRRLLSLRPRWFDVILILWCVCPLPTSLSNGLGPFDGFSGILSHFIIWGSPYLLGRIYFIDRE